MMVNIKKSSTQAFISQKISKFLSSVLPLKSSPKYIPNILCSLYSNWIVLAWWGMDFETKTLTNQVCSSSWWKRIALSQKQTRISVMCEVQWGRVFCQTNVVGFMIGIFEWLQTCVSLSVVVVREIAKSKHTRHSWRWRFLGDLMLGYYNIHFKRNEENLNVSIYFRNWMSENSKHSVFYIKTTLSD